MSTDSPGTRRRRVLVHVALVLLAVAAFAPGLTSPLTHYDDPLYLDRAELAAPGWSGLAALWSGKAAWSGQFLEFFPLRDSIYWLIFQRWGKWPLPYHVASLFFHVLATVLLFRFVERLKQTFWVASATALLFAVHPIHIESVVWAAGLKDPLYTCFVLGSLITYLDYRGRQRPARYALAIGLLICGLLVKSMALSTPLIMLAVERLIDQPTPWKSVFARLSGPVLICAIFLWQFLAIAKLNPVRTTLHQGNLVAHVVLVAWAQVVYLRQVFFPSAFRLIYCFLPVESLADPRFLAGCLLLLSVAAALYFWRSRALFSFCVAFYFSCLLPVSNLLPFSAVMADRYLYAASIGSSLLIALLLDAASDRLKNTVLPAIIAALALTTALRSAVWQDEELLWQESDEDPVCLQDPEFPAADVHFLRFVTASDKQTKLRALERLLITRGAKGDSFGLRCEALLNGAVLYEETGDHANATRWLQLGVSDCHSNPHQLAKTMLLVSMHHEPRVAEEAAARWYQLSPSPATNLFRLLTALEVLDEVAKRQGIAQLVQSSPRETCQLLWQWSTEVSDSLRAAVAPALSWCKTGP